MQNTPVQPTSQNSPLNMLSRPSSNETAVDPNNSFQQVLARQAKSKPEQSQAPNAANGQNAKAQNSKDGQTAKGAQADNGQAPQEAAASVKRPAAFQDINAIAADGKTSKRGVKDDDDKEIAVAAMPDASVIGLPAMAASVADGKQPVADVAKEENVETTATDAQPQQGKLDRDLSKMLTEGKPAAATTNASDDQAGAQQGVDADSKTDVTAWIERMLPKKGDTAVDKTMLDALTENKQSVHLQDTPAIQQTVAPVQNTAAQAIQLQATEAAGSSNYISAYPGRAGWDEAIGQKVSWMVGNGDQSATLTLNPPDLGPLQVVIHVHNDQADASFMSNNQEVRQALQDGMDNLRQMMSSAGIQLGQTNVGEHTQSQAAFDMGKSAGRDSGNAQSDDGQGNVAATGQAIPVRAGNGLVDTFV